MGEPRDTPRDVVSWRRQCAAGDCVEVGQDVDQVLVRNSREPDGPWLRFTHQEWSVFLAGVRNGFFDLPPEPEVSAESSG